MQVARGTTDGLDQRALRAQEAFLVRVEDRHQRHLGHVQAFAQQVDPHQHVERTGAQVADDLHSLDGIDVRVQVAHPHVVIAEIIGEVLGHALGQGSHQHPLVLGHPLADLREQVIHLGHRRAYLDLRIDQPGGTHHLLDDPPGMFRLVGARGGGDEDGLRTHRLPLFEAQRPVVQRRRQAETVFHQGLLARAVALEHRTDLRNADVRFVDNQQRVGRQVVVERRRRLAGGPPGKIARVVLDAVAVAQFEDHLQVETGALLQALRFHQLVAVAQVVQAFLEFGLDLVDRLQQRLARSHVVALGVEGEARQLADHLAGERIEGREAFHLVVEQLDTNRLEIGFGREDVDHIATHTESRTGEIHVVAGVLQAGQSPQQFALVDAVAAVQVQDHLQVGRGITEAVDGRHGGDDDRIRTLEQRLGRRQAHLLDMVVDRGVLLDIGIGRRYVGLRLVVVVVGNEVLHGIVREERLELPVELGRQGLVWRQDQGRALHLGNHVGDAESLARARHPQQGLVRKPRLQPLDHLPDGFRLVAGGLEARVELERIHEKPRREL
ncbi:hypothetical protein PA99_1389 [Pseudomonas aeruginosa PA99]|nr:hypothetical protein PA99_1389 [Pseudomonas aeruginosa PA99]